MSAKITLTLTPEQWDDLRRAVAFAAAESFEKYSDARTQHPEDQKTWMAHDDNYARWKRLSEKVLV